MSRNASSEWTVKGSQQARESVENRLADADASAPARLRLAVATLEACLPAAGPEAFWWAIFGADLARDAKAKDPTATELQEVALALLERADIPRLGHRLSGLYDEVADSTPTPAGSWEDLFAADVGRLRRRDTAHDERQQRLLTTGRFLDFLATEAADAVPTPTRAMCQRLSGDYDAAARTVQLGKKLPEQSIEDLRYWEWEEASLRATVGGDLGDLDTTVQRQARLRRWPELHIWYLWKIATGTEEKDLPRIRTLREAAAAEGVRTVGPLRHLAAALSPRGDTYQKAERLVSSMMERQQLPDWQVQTLYTAAVATWFAHHGFQEVATMALREYQGASLVASQGQRWDVFGVLGEHGTRVLRELDPKALEPRAQSEHFFKMSLGLAKDALVRKARGGRERSWESELQRLEKHLPALKGMIQKFQQMAGIMQELVPEPLAEVLTRTRQQTAVMNPELAKSIVEEELGISIDEAFSRWDKWPVAAASLGQVHRAQLADGQHVAVKVQFPHIVKSLERQLLALRMLKPLYRLANPGRTPSTLMAALQGLFAKEIDYGREADLHESMTKLLADCPGVSVPGLIRSHSRDRILTSEFVQGIPFQDFVASMPQEVKDQCAAAIWRAQLRTFFSGHICNFDLNPGNFLFADGTVHLLDFGACIELSEGVVAETEAFFNGIACNDFEAAKSNLIDHGYVRDVKNFDFAKGYEAEQAIYGPFVSHDFRFTAEQLRLVGNTLRPNLKFYTVRRDRLCVTAWLLSLHGLFASLNARCDWRAELEAYSWFNRSAA